MEDASFDRLPASLRLRRDEQDERIKCKSFLIWVYRLHHSNNGISSPFISTGQFLTREKLSSFFKGGKLKGAGDDRGGGGFDDCGSMVCGEEEKNTGCMMQDTGYRI
jgi:hypothetical protein